MTNLQLRKSIDRSLLRPTCLFIAFAFLPRIWAAPDPAPPPGANTRDGAGAMAHITTGQFNSAFGTNALNRLTIGNNNAAQGNSALFSNINGNGNVALGSLALRLNVSGDRNTAIGYSALLNNTADRNTAVGWKALTGNTSGTFNVAVGSVALINNTTGSANDAFGDDALHDNTTGTNNMAFGDTALAGNTSGVGNVAVGAAALFDITTGDYNTAIGHFGGFFVTGTGNVSIGAFVEGIPGENNTTRIRNVYASVAATRAVYVNSSNKIGTLASSRRFKDAIKPMDKASEAILALKPVSFCYKQEVDPDRIPMFGLVAEEVEHVNPDLVSRDEEGKAFTVRYEAVNVMLLNEFLKEHRTVQELKATVAEQQKQIEALTTGLRKVSAQLETSKPAPQVVNNP